MSHQPSLAREQGHGLLPRWWSPVRRFLAGHPVICLLLLAPEVEYLTGSTQMSLLIGNPPIFFLFLAQNLGSYGAAVLLIREAKVRWNKGWGTVLLLGAAYGIVNEGLGAGTLFNPHTAGAAGLAPYGHWLGINWVNVAILIPFVHPLYSVSLPILLLDLALPETKGKPFLTMGEVRLTLLVLGTDAFATSYFVSTFLTRSFAGPVLLGGSLVAILLLAIAAWWVPPDLVHPRSPLPTAAPSRFALLGAILPWAVFLGGALLVGHDAPPSLVAIWIIAGSGLAFLWVLRHIGRRENSPQLVALSGGLVSGLIPMGISSQIGTGIGLVAVFGGDLVAILFFRYLWIKYRPLLPPKALRPLEQPQ